jgi:hypothetical protein
MHLRELQVPFLELADDRGVDPRQVLVTGCLDVSRAAPSRRASSSSAMASCASTYSATPSHAGRIGAWPDSMTFLNWSTTRYPAPLSKLS